MPREIFTSPHLPGTYAQEIGGALIMGIYERMKAYREAAAEIFLTDAVQMLNRRGLAMTSAVATASLVDDDGHLLEKRGTYEIPMIVPREMVDGFNKLPALPTDNSDGFIRRPPLKKFALDRRPG